MRVLHITTWFPNRKNNSEALWIKRHIDSLNLFCENEVWHIRTIENSSLKYEYYTSHAANHRLVHLPTSKWIIIELTTFFQLLWFGIFNRPSIKKANVINFHIAYPALSFWKLLRFFFKKPVVITEHWSAYHFGFGVSKPLSRIQNIFSHNIPVITVSKALKHDIEQFSGYKINGCIIPNVVDSNIFNCRGEENNKIRFFMVSQWTYPKDPLYIINTFEKLLENNVDAELIIGGYGNQVKEIVNKIEEKGLSKNISFIGKLTSEEIANEMNKATAFIHISDYETFSVVCAEAISCGCPLIASNVGGIKEFISKKNGVLLNEKAELLNAMHYMAEKRYVRREIAKDASAKFSKQNVGQLYFNILQNIIDGTFK